MDDYGNFLCVTRSRQQKHTVRYVFKLIAIFWSQKMNYQARKSRRENKT